MKTRRSFPSLSRTRQQNLGPLRYSPTPQPLTSVKINKKYIFFLYCVCIHFLTVSGKRAFFSHGEKNCIRILKELSWVVLAFCNSSQEWRRALFSIIHIFIQWPVLSKLPTSRHLHRGLHRFKRSCSFLVMVKHSCTQWSCRVLKNLQMHYVTRYSKYCAA